MYIDASTIITAASVVGGLGVLGGAVAHVVRIVQRDKRQSAAIKAKQTSTLHKMLSCFPEVPEWMVLYHISAPIWQEAVS